MRLIWFDTPNVGDKMTPELADGLAQIVRTTQPACLIDGRLGATGDYTSTGDNAIPNLDQKGDWETPATVNHTWGFKKDDTDWKSPGEIAFKLIDITSKGGNYLLNVGPMSNGIIPQECQDNLRTVGRWLKVNGEAVYGAGRSPFGPEFGEYSADLKDHAGKPIFLSRTSWRCTTKPGKLYFTIVRFYPDDRRKPALSIPALSFPRLLLADQESLFRWQGDRTWPGLKLRTASRIVKMPRNPIDPMATVICVEIGGDSVRLLRWIALRSPTKPGEGGIPSAPALPQWPPEVAHPEHGIRPC